MKTQYNECKLESVDEKPDNWVTKLEKLAERLDKIGLKISDHDLKIHILNNLPSAYDATVEIIEADIKNYTIPRIRPKLNQIYQKFLRRGNKSKSAPVPEGIEATMFLATAFKGRCYNCGKFGHKSTECPEKKKDYNNNNYSNYKKGPKDKKKNFVVNVTIAEYMDTRDWTAVS